MISTFEIADAEPEHEDRQHHDLGHRVRNTAGLNISSNQRAGRRKPERGAEERAEGEAGASA